MDVIDSDIKFPSMDNYDMSKPGDMALYLAACDFLPFRSVIDINRIAIDAINEHYHEIVKKTMETDDFEAQCRAMTSGTLLNCRVDIQVQYSLLLVLVSLLEEAVNTFCQIHKEMDGLTTELKDIKGSGLERAAKYIKDEIHIEGFASGNWEYITAIRDARNMVVHNGGRVVKEKDFLKFDKFKIGYREEDKQIYLENGDIVKFYDAFWGFLETSFKLEPSA